MQDFSIQGATPPPVSPVARAFTTPSSKAGDNSAREPKALATEPKTAQLSDHDLFLLEIEAKEDGAIDIPGDNAPSAFFGKDGLSFSDLIDVINPLQHIPVVSTLYRELTGDEISPGARMAGGALYGGPIGFAMATINSIVETTTGADIGETIVTAFSGSDAAATPPAATVVANDARTKSPIST